MSWSDTIADMFTRVRNGLMAGHVTVDVPHSRLKGEIMRILKREGYVNDFTVEGGPRKVLRVYLKYGPDKSPAIRGIERVSRAGGRKYAAVEKIPRVLGGYGIVILSTSKGLMTDREARSAKIGGEVVGKVW